MATEKKEVKHSEPKEYKVRATKNLGSSITGGARIAKGKDGKITMAPERYERLKKHGYFE